MKDEKKTKKQLIEELENLARRVVELEKTEIERRQAEEAFKENEELFSQFMKYFPGSAYIKDSERRIIHLTENIEAYFGIKPEEWLGKTSEEIWPPELAAKVREDDEAVLKGKIVKSITERPQKGSLHTWITQRFPIHRKNKPPLIGCISIDISDRIKAEKALRESEERYRTVFDQSNDGIALVKGDQHILVNQKMVEIFGYDRPEEIIGSPITFLVHPDDQERVRDINRRRQKGEAVPNKYEFKGRRKNGDPIYIEVSATKTTFQGETVALVFLRNITDRKQAEETLQTLSLKDDLTGLYNRRGFFALAEQGLKTAQRNGIELLLIFGDLDNLKRINDTLGHKEGDRALIDMSHILKETFRESDIVARIGGDEFVILAMNSFETSAEKLINRFEKVLNDHHLQRDCSYKLSMSLGMACFDPQNPCSIDVLLAQADRMMYENKQKRQTKSG